MKKILVTGGDGQLARCIKDVSSKYAEDFTFVYRNSLELNIADEEAVSKELECGTYDYCINCAAYTHVDNAEKEKEKAISVNHIGSKNLAIACKKHGTMLLHISTDFVFNGIKRVPYTEEDIEEPLSVYGSTKLFGEKEIKNNTFKYFIIRTSWLYSEYGHNFMKSMLKLGKEKEELSVVNDQIGTPTYAKDLAEVLLLFIVKENTDYGIYNYSNEGTASWYDFATAIFEISNISVKVHPIPSKEYPLPAQRPNFSVLDKAKIKEALKIEIPNWKDSLLKACKTLS
ncbi:dTDP-4-dehydrorhamnose reductase [uncultured Maribacter sp.]|uniref:dTDP-4-dehydrorhamnose reductase n=1 Tax=uncultured Maribacter sp. TaxID=431308 RepID=UPI0026316770|nr:dTDP-4-dehydrorhamnose reductase [uncultured Maribacter sp.]